MRLNGISRIQAFITQEHTLCLHGLSRDKGQVRLRWVAVLKGFNSTVCAHGFECAFHARGPFLTCGGVHDASAIEVCRLLHSNSIGLAQNVPTHSTIYFNSGSR